MSALFLEEILYSYLNLIKNYTWRIRYLIVSRNTINLTNNYKIRELTKPENVFNSIM